VVLSWWRETGHDFTERDDTSVVLVGVKCGESSFVTTERNFSGSDAEFAKDSADGAFVDFDGTFRNGFDEILHVLSCG
jgi:hypothetical protein